MLPLYLLITVFTASTVCQFYTHNTADHDNEPWCDFGWMHNWAEQKCVRYFLTSKTRTEAPSFCEANDASIVEISNYGKQDFLTRRGRSSKKGYWIYDNVDERNWTPRQIFEGNSSYDCVRITDSSFEKRPCYGPYYFICEQYLGNQRTCGYGWAEYVIDGRHICYFPFRHQRTYDESVTQCARYNNGTLAIPSSARRYSIIQWVGQIFMSGYWIGMRDSNTAGMEYADGTRVPDCQLLKTGANGTITKAECNSRRNVACEKPMTPPITKQECNSGWIKFDGWGETNDRCISYFSTKATMTLAEFSCRIHNAKLINITTSAKYDFVIDNRPNIDVDYWIGAYYEKAKKWSPIDLISGNQKLPCVALMSYNKGFERIPCSYRIRYVCERPTHGRILCPNGWTYCRDEHQTVCLFSPAYNSTYMGSAADCRERGGYLARPNSQMKYTKIQNARSMIGDYHYVGMVRSSQTGAMSFDDGPDIESCRWLGTRNWDVSDYGDCSVYKHFICEQPIGTP